MIDLGVGCCPPPLQKPKEEKRKKAKNKGKPTATEGVMEKVTKPLYCPSFPSVTARNKPPFSAFH